MIFQKIINWFKNKSIGLSEKNIKEYLENIIVIANQAYDNLQRTGEDNPTDTKKVQKAKDKLIIELCGPIPLDEVKEKLIDPVLQREDLTEGAKIAINHAFDYAKQNIRE